MYKSVMTQTISSKNKNNFNTESVLFVRNLIDKDICLETLHWLEENEDSIIKKFKEDKRGLVCEYFKGKECIKYFEYPLYANAKIFTKFMNSRIFKYASDLLDDEVIFKSLEIHSRFPGSELIPMHQDNAYYGLNNGKALTFYIPINYQSYKSGGLRYLAIKNENFVFEHIPSKSSGFSLEIKNKEEITKKYDQKLFDFEPGDCSIHYSNSIHFAEEVPLESSRSWVARFSFFSSNASTKPGHREWYQKMIDINRTYNNKL